MRTKLFLLAIILIGISGCKVVQPEYTYVENVMKLKKGMTPTEVSAFLDILPYDIYHVQFGYSAVYLYKYKYEERKVSSTLLQKREGLAGGTQVYTKSSNLYACFNNDKLTTLFTDEGYKYGRHIVLFENSVKTMNENPSDFISPPDGSKSFRKLTKKEKKQNIDIDLKLKGSSDQK